MTKRKIWIDYSKGIGILAIILGHTTFKDANFLFWFHVPIFFIISGFLFNEERSIFKFFERKFISLLVPYFVIGILSTILYLILTFHIELTYIFRNLYSLLYGGTKLSAVLGAYWYLPVLFLSELIFLWFIRRFGTKFIHLCFFILGNYVLFYFLKDQRGMIMNLNIIPIALVYLTVGFLIRKNIMYWKELSLVNISILLSSFIIIFYFDFNLVIDLKYGVSNVLLLDVIIPISISIFIFSISLLIEKIRKKEIKCLIFFAENSLILMLIHNLYIHTLRFYGVDSWEVIFILSVILSCLSCVPVRGILNFISMSINYQLNNIYESHNPR